MKINPYFRYSIYAAIISILLMLQNVPHIFSANFMIGLLTIWTCLLFFASFEQYQRRSRQNITHQIQQHPEAIPEILNQTTLTRADLKALSTSERSFKFSELKVVQNILNQY